jgi:hypothetical protein
MAPNSGASSAASTPKIVRPRLMSRKDQPNSWFSGPMKKPMVLNGIGEAPHITPSIEARSTFQPRRNSERLGVGSMGGSVAPVAASVNDTPKRPQRKTISSESTSFRRSRAQARPPASARRWFTSSSMPA